MANFSENDNDDEINQNTENIDTNLPGKKEKKRTSTDKKSASGSKKDNNKIENGEDKYTELGLRFTPLKKKSTKN